MSMDTKSFIDSVMTLPEEKTKPVASYRQSFVMSVKMKIVRAYWKTKHLFKCEERHMTERAMMRYCHKCGRTTIGNPELRTAYRRGGLPGLFKKKHEILTRKRSTEMGTSR